MPRHRHLGYRYLKTIRADTASHFSRIRHVDGQRAIISKITDAQFEVFESWAHGSRQEQPDVSNKKIRRSSLKVASESPNHGQIVAVKDNFVTALLPTTCASNILHGFRASAASTVCKLLEQHGMKVVAKTNMDEFGMGSHSTYSAYGAVRSRAYPKEQSVGGSSGGSAVAVAGRFAHAAIGSDTGGSVRLPAAYTHIVGFKPSYGRISRQGLVPYANSLDTVGIMAKDVLNVWLMYKMLDVHDPEDPTSLSNDSRKRIEIARNKRYWVRQGNRSNDSFVRSVAAGKEPPRFAKPKGESVGTLKTKDRPANVGRRRRIGVPNEYNIEELHPLVRQAWLRTLCALSMRGHDIVPISLPNTRQALAAYYVLAPAEASSNLAKYDGVRYGRPRATDAPDDAGGTLYAEHRGKNFGEEVKRRILLGTFSLSAGAMDNYFIQAQKVRRLVQEDFNLVFRMAHPLMEGAEGAEEGVDLIICPTAPTLPPLLKDLEEQTPLDSYINDVFTVPASLAGLPAISVPAIYDRDAPVSSDRNIGMQIIGQYGDDPAVLTFARIEVEPVMHAASHGQFPSHSHWGTLR